MQSLTQQQSSLTVNQKKTMHTFILIIFYGKNDCFEIQISPIVTVRVSIMVNYDTWRLV